MDVKQPDSGKPISFVTGATGFLGSHLVDQLLERGHEVHVLVRKSSNLQWLLGKSVQFHYGDLGDHKKGLYEGLQSADFCFHIAGVVAARRAVTYYQVNTVGTANVLEACLEFPGLKKIVVVTSLAAHGPAKTDAPSRENEPCHPITDYGRSKRDAELVVARYQDRLPITIVRPPAIYGPRDTATFNFFKLARLGWVPLPSGESGLNLAHVSDIVDGIILAAIHPKSAGETFYVGDEKNYPWEEVARMLGHAFRKRPRLLRVPFPVLYAAGLAAEGYAWLTRGTPTFNRGQAKNFIQKNWGVDIGKTQAVLGYQPRIPLAEGLEQTAVWYEAEGWL